MSETALKTEKPAWKIRHRGRLSQIPIYLGKQIRFFINQNDWKVIPMAAVIAALVSMVIRKKFFFNMEGGLMGAFALTCVAIWNGCFNSIQAVCRERPIIKREHRSGMHISSYVAAHMIYQLMLCAAQTGVSLYVMKMVGVKFPEQGFMTPFMMVDIGITMLLISYASDMLSLLISSVARTTTGAMTIMPFVLIFQLVFSGGVIPLPAWAAPMAELTISNYGIRAIAAQSGYNELPMVTGWNTLEKMKDSEIGGSITVGQILDFLDQPNEAIDSRRDQVVLPAVTAGEALQAADSTLGALQIRDAEIVHPVSIRSMTENILTSDAELVRKLRDFTLIPSIGGSKAVTVENVLSALLTSPDTQELLDGEIGPTITLGQAMDALRSREEVQNMTGMPLNDPVTLGQVIDFVVNNPTLQNHRDHTFTVKTTVGEVMKLFGEERVKTLVQETTARVSRNPAYDRTEKNIVNNWMSLIGFIALFALMATLALKMIDKDKR